MNEVCEAALYYAEKFGWPVHPIAPNRRPMTANGFYDATTDRTKIEWFFGANPGALIGARTGSASGMVALDVDRKNGLDGARELEKLLDGAAWPEAPTCVTPRGGWHIHLATDGREIPSWNPAPGLELKAEKSSIIVPSSQSGYFWDQQKNLSIPLMVAPAWLIKPADPVGSSLPEPPRDGEITEFAAAVLNDAYRRLRGARCGEQQSTLNRECFSIGTLVAAGQIPKTIALDHLLKAARRMKSYDQRRPWGEDECEGIARRAFAQGLGKPRK